MDKPKPCCKRKKTPWGREDTQLVIIGVLLISLVALAVVGLIKFVM